MSMGKQCAKCNIEKTEHNCSPYEFKKSGGYCKLCKSIWYKNNKQDVIAAQKIYYENNKENILSKQKGYYTINKQEILNYATSYRNEHKKESQKYNQQYRFNNRLKLSAYRRGYEKNRRIIDLEYKLKNDISNSINRQLKIIGSLKNRLSVSEFLPYSISDLKIHLEKQFEPWMTWKNRGKYESKIWDDYDTLTWKWQIDHIIPHSTFKYSSMEDEEFQKCWALSNLRPLSAKQNIRDNARRGGSLE